MGLSFPSVGETGFEPAAPASRTQCSTGLSYSPLFHECDTLRRRAGLGLAASTDGVGFEPTRACAPHDFQSCSLSRSDTRPRGERRGRDSNPRGPSGPNALAGRRLKPLGHLSQVLQAGSAAGLRRPPHRAARPSSCPSWARTRTLLIQSQTCCQLHQGARNYEVRTTNYELRPERATGLEPATLSLGS
jgi:hypothetical protein